jgi:hypothetical protein
VSRLPTKLQCPQSLARPEGEGGCRSHLDPGDELTCRLLVYNAAEEVDEVRAQIGGAFAQWARVEPDRLPLLPEAEGALELVIRLPLDAEVEAGTHGLLVEVLSGLPGIESSVEECLVDVGRITDAQLTVRPGPGGPRYGWYDIVVDNRSNHPLRLHLDVAAPVSVEIPQPVLEVAPFGRATAEARLHDRGWDGREIPVTVSATGDGLDLSAALTHQVRPSAPRPERGTRPRQQRVDEPPAQPREPATAPAPTRCMSRTLLAVAALVVLALLAVADQPGVVLLVATPVAVWLLFGYAGCRIMTQKGRGRWSGWLLGLLLGPIGLIAAAVSSDAAPRTGRP